jgi:hypothetical protein
MEIFKTKNLFVAAYLQASGEVKFLGLEILDSKTKLFKFSPSDIASSLESEYFSGGQLSVKTVFAEYNNLKDLLFNFKEEAKWMKN